LLGDNDQTVLHGKKVLQEQVFSKFPLYVKETEENTGSGLAQYNAVLTNEALVFDTRLFGQKLCAWLLKNRPQNFTFLNNSEVCELMYNK
jgi:hypothetical protein